ncbi:MAG TPA: ComEC/Rec2 family competence protein, partial [Symbiobacteriaceae bacterium]|nr:ComEC/Rec2 family competence protein [Symbiobacteriaceae bacterium]
MVRPALWMAAALAVGIAAAEWLRPHPALALAAVVASAAWLLRTRRQLWKALLLTAAMLGILLHAWSQTAGRGDLAAWQGGRVTLTGTVTTEPELREPRGGIYVVSVEQVGAHVARGKLYVAQGGGQLPRFGERVELQGTLKAPAGPRTPGGFDQAAYLSRQGVYMVIDTPGARSQGPGSVSFLRRWAVSARIRLEGVLRATLPPRESALMAGLLFGSRSDLPDDIKEAFKT